MRDVALGLAALSFGVATYIDAPFRGALRPTLTLPTRQARSIGNFAVSLGFLCLSIGLLRRRR